MTAKKTDLPRAEKEFYELKINTLNERIGRIKQRCNDLEKENVEIKKQYKNLEEESSDIIAFLKRSITQKHDEIKIVTEKLQALQSTKATEKDKYQEQIQTLEKDYKTMHDTFAAEAKLLAGQLSSLESFKNNREAMVKKLISLEEELKKKDEHHSLALRNNENKYILMKEKLSAYVEEKLLKLSLDLQKQTQYTVSETTHTVVKENIAINNELNLIIGSWQKIVDENEKLKDLIEELKTEVKITNELKEKTMQKNYVLNQVIGRLKEEHDKMCDKIITYEESNANIEERLEECMKEKLNAIQESKQKDAMYQETAEIFERLQNDYKKNLIQNYKLEKIIKKVVIKIQEVIGLQENKTANSICDEEEFALRRQLLNSLLDLFDGFALFEKEKLDEIESSESDDDYTWIKLSPTLKLCALIKEVKEKYNCNDEA